MPRISGLPAANTLRIGARSKRKTPAAATHHQPAGSRSSDPARCEPPWPARKASKKRWYNSDTVTEGAPTHAGPAELSRSEVRLCLANPTATRLIALTRGAKPGSGGPHIGFSAKAGPEGDHSWIRFHGDFLIHGFGRLLQPTGVTTCRCG